MDVISWDNITNADNDQPEEFKPSEPVETLTTVTNLKKKRGRPPKVALPMPTLPTPPTSGSNTPVRTEEEMMSTTQLLSALTMSGDKSPKAPALKFNVPDDDEEASIEADVDMEILLRIYESFFQEPLNRRHSIRRRPFSHTTPKKTIESELKKLSRAVGCADPAADLGSIWAKGMAGIEYFAVPAGYPVLGLGAVAAQKAASPEFTDTFRELLIKYPRLRSYMALGGFPEVKLLVMSAMVTQEVLNNNLQKYAAASEKLHKLSPGSTPSANPDKTDHGIA